MKLYVRCSKVSGELVRGEAVNITDHKDAARGAQHSFFTRQVQIEVVDVTHEAESKSYSPNPCHTLVQEVSFCLPRCLLAF
jgi:hypothetical protein